jgi:anti-sigma factor RsiW
MNHPNREEWVPYVVGEATREGRQKLDQHLRSCAACRAELETWKRSLKRLDAWKLPQARRSAESWLPFLRWATAVCLLLALGFGLGRFAPSPGNSTRTRAEMEARIREELRAQLVSTLRQETAKAASAALAASSDLTQAWLAEYARTVDAKLETERLERVGDCLSLKRELDTIAVNADDGLRHAQARFSQLVDLRPPPRLPLPLDNHPIHD